MTALQYACQRAFGATFRKSQSLFRCQTWQPSLRTLASVNNDLLRDKEVTVVGAGAMAHAMMAGLISNQVLDPAQVTVTDIHQKRLDTFSSSFQVSTTTDNVAAVEQADLIVLAIKPQSLPKLAQTVTSHIHEDDLVLSIMAGCGIDKLKSSLKCDNIVRSMPNTPAAVAKSMTVWTCEDTVSQEHRDMAVQLIEGFGQAMFVQEERYMDMVTALSGTGPSYFYLIMEAMIDSGVHLGLTRQMSRQLVVETMFGSVCLARETNQHPAMLRESITSPGGTSSAALHALERGNLRSVLSDSVWAAYRRSLEMGGEDSNLGPGRSVRQPETAGLDDATLEALTNIVQVTESLSDLTQDKPKRRETAKSG
eukprot:TRINITY_DN4668_c0_g1_i2.p1 TRINITY_DN4668_c0_g1~~TRINITY_DN4668_c0_g1_i2.p1  ORF type:complete len:366 (+),score=92.70 TRINITY_DN4668_c0_g1_i2:117-1214(+)